jgi:hypothetical protein
MDPNLASVIISGLFITALTLVVFLAIIYRQKEIAALALRLLGRSPKKRFATRRRRKEGEQQQEAVNRNR